MSNRKSPKPIYLVDARAKLKAIAQIDNLPVDGTYKVTIAGARDKSARQRGLQWMWYDDVVESGIGGQDESTKDRVHLKAKALWCLPIQIRDDEDFAEMYLDFHRRWHKRPEWEHKFEWFVERVVSTEDLNQAQMAEFLTSFKDHYGYELGVELTDPDARGWANLLEGAA